jgi:hypothetical protein
MKSEAQEQYDAEIAQAIKAERQAARHNALINCVEFAVNAMIVLIVIYCIGAVIYWLSLPVEF